MKQYVKRPIKTWLIISLFTFLIVPVNSFVPSSVKGDIVSASSVRDRMMEIAEAYVNHVWTPTVENVFHGERDDLPVDTPDVSAWAMGGWWIPDQENIGVPYQWGGFSSISGLDLVNPEDFDDQYRGEGRFAGNIRYAGDIACLDAKIECTKACGVDCSGFVSRCWNLPYKHNTAVGPYGLIHESWPIKFENLKEGDMLIDPSGFDRHVMLFKRFLTPDKTQIEVYEASAWDWKVSERVYDCVVNDQPYWAYDRNNQGHVQMYGKGHGVVLTHDSEPHQYWAYSHIRPILFDDTHDEDNDGLEGPHANYGKLKNRLEEEGYIIDELDTGPITYDILREYGILIFPDIEDELVTEEVRAMTNFLNGDGRILIIGEWKGAHLPESASRLSMAAGNRFDNTNVQDPDNNMFQNPNWAIIHNINPSHDIGEGISVFVIYHGSSLTLTDPTRATAIAWGDSNTCVFDPIGDGTLPDAWSGDVESSGPHSSAIIVLASSSYLVSGGEARLVCTVDSDLWKNGNIYEWGDYDPIEEYDNRKLLVNIIDWLSAFVSPPSTQQPGFGMISRGEMTTSSVNIVKGAPELKIELSWPGSDLDLGVEGPSERHIGYNPTTDLAEIPEATYSGNDVNPEWVRIQNPEPGDWKIFVYGRDVAGNYELYRIDVPDTFPPTAVTDLSTLDYSLDSISLVWTSPGGDGNRGSALTYDIRYSTEPITDLDEWERAFQCEGEPTPQPAGSVEAFAVTGLSPSTTYYFALKSADGVPNWSGLSNGAMGKTVVLASVDFDPNTLNLKSKGKWVTAYVELPEGHDASEIDITSIMLNGVVHASTKPVEIADCDQDGVTDLMVKFDRASVMELFAGKEAPDDYVVKVEGLVAGTRFVGTDTITVISPGKKDK